MKLFTCFVTFDQPLYQKSFEMVKSCSEEFPNVMVRLGIFHLLMSFLGAIGFIMSGSGINEVLNVIYAPLSVQKMLTGHAYARAIRGHTLLYLALCKRILEETELTDEEKSYAESRMRSFFYRFSSNA